MPHYNCFSRWRASTGKFDVVVTRLEDSDYEHQIRESTELREFINDNYDLSASGLAAAILRSYLGAVKVEVQDYNRNAVILEKEYYGTSDI